MSKYVKSIRVETQFEGDTVVAVFRPMDYPTALKFQSLVEKAPTVVVTDDDGRQRETVQPTAEMADFFRDATAAHLESLTGLKDANGEAVSKDEVLQGAYFISLVTTLASAWAERSSPKGEA